MNSSSHPGTNDASVTKLRELIQGIRIAMLTTVGPDGALFSRPMATQQLPFDGTLWFFTAADSGKTDDIAHEHHVNVSYSDPSDSRYISVSGLAAVVHDREKARLLWSPIVKAWFPGGVDDPNLALLRVNVQSAEYWDAPQGKMVQLFSIAKAAVTGTTPKNIGEHAKLDLATADPAAHSSVKYP